MDNLTDYAGQLASVGRQIKQAGGPGKWLRARFVEFMLGMAIGAVSGVADSLASALGAVEESIRYAGTQAAAAFATVEATVLGTLNWILAELDRAVAIAGPLGPFVYAVIAVVLLALAWRAIRALADSIPVVSGIQTLLEGN